jgi:hypothetical protein
VAAPEFVPVKPTDQPRSYTSPPWRPDEWVATRPAEVVGDVVERDEGRVGSPGPDQGYIWTLTPLVADDINLAEHEHLDDVLAGAVAVGLKRASSFGRAPVVHDLRVALTIWGYLDVSPAPELVERRRKMFEGVANPHHYPELRAVVDAVPEESLRQTPGQAEEAHRADWRALLHI